MDVTSAKVMPSAPNVEWMSEAIASGVFPAVRSAQIWCPIEMMLESSPDGHVKPRLCILAMNVSSVLSASAIAVLVVRAALTITGTVSLASQRREDIFMPFLIVDDIIFSTTIDVVSMRVRRRESTTVEPAEDLPAWRPERSVHDKRFNDLTW